jgi:hypothetical protein
MYVAELDSAQQPSEIETELQESAKTKAANKAEPKKEGQPGTNWENVSGFPRNPVKEATKVSLDTGPASWAGSGPYEARPLFMILMTQAPMEFRPSAGRSLAYRNSWCSCSDKGARCCSCCLAPAAWLQGTPLGCMAADLSEATEP